MNIAQLKLSQKKLLDNLVSRGYDIQYIKGVKFVLRLLFEHEGCFHSYEQFAKSLSVQGDIQKRHWILG